MAYKIVYSNSYVKQVRVFLKKHPAMEGLYSKVLRLLTENPKHPSLRLHALQGRLKGLSSISINLKYRITLQFIIQEETLILIDIGSHDEVYRG